MADGPKAFWKKVSAAARNSRHPRLEGAVPIGGCATPCLSALYPVTARVRSAV